MSEQTPVVEEVKPEAQVEEVKPTVTVGSTEPVEPTSEQMSYRIQSLKSAAFAYALSLNEVMAVCQLANCSPLQFIESSNVTFDPARAGDAAWH